ncbi:MAG: UDP-N-acetylmuramate dehydrogenase, partial [Acutalibacteraceae bacterium]
EVEMKYNIDFFQDIAQEDFELVFQEPMKKHTSFRIGGNADLFCTVHSLDALSKVLKGCQDNHIPLTILGKGSNVLVSDLGIRGMVLRLKGVFTEIRKISEDRIYCGAGVSLAALCLFAKENSLSGLEFAWGIPGSVGGAVYMNAGAYNGEIKDVVTAVTHVSMDGTVGKIEGNALDFGYRHSAYFNGNKIITGAFFKLKKGLPLEIGNEMDSFMNRRKDKQPLDFPSAGSIFKRPKGNYAAALIEQCSLKGVSVGGACVSPKHSGFIINTGNATCQDVIDLINYIQRVVKEQKGVDLVCEVRRIGE